MAHRSRGISSNSKAWLGVPLKLALIFWTKGATSGRLSNSSPEWIRVQPSTTSGESSGGGTEILPRGQSEPKAAAAREKIFIANLLCNSLLSREPNVGCQE